MIIGMAFELITLSIIFIIKYRNDFIGLNRKLQKEKEQQAFLASELIKSQETERQAIADNLHDGLGNTLNALKLTLTSTGNFENDNIQKIFSLANQQFRELIYQIAPKEIGEYGLYRATEQSLNVFKASRIQFSINFMGNENLLSEGLKINIYRIFQELINNIIRHSDASFVEITIDTNEKEFILQIEDNGNGVAQDMREGMGIKSIKNRTAYYNGTYHQENLNPGMISIIQIPLNNENNKNYYSG
ncbi:sensor histidine kinase [Elizabethkingia anophelis]